MITLPKPLYEHGVYVDLLDTRLLSSHFKLDPGMMGSQIEKHDARIAKLLKRAKKAIIEELGELDPSSPGFDPKTFETRMKHVVESVVLAPATKEVEENQVQAFAKGEKRGVQFLNTGGIPAEAPPTKRGLEAPGRTPEEILRILRTSYLSQFQGITLDMEQQIMHQISDGILAGEGARAIAKRIDGVMGSTLARASKIARTETMKAYNVAAEQQYAKHGIKMYRWVTAMKPTAKGNPVCTICHPQEGKTFPLGKGPVVAPTGPPAHPHCRCIKIPVIEEVN